jgi:hypothetical protein
LRSFSWELPFLEERGLLEIIPMWSGNYMNIICIFEEVKTARYKNIFKKIRKGPFCLFVCLFFIIHLVTCAYIVWVISPPASCPHSLLPTPPCFQAEPVLPLSLILLKRRHKHNKKDKAFLLVELRIAIQRDS